MGFKVLCYLQSEKIESFYKIYIFVKKYHLHWTAGRANILCKDIIYDTYDIFSAIIYIIYNTRIFPILGVAFAVPFLFFFLKAPAFCGKKNFEIIFATFYFHLNELKNCISDL